MTKLQNCNIYAECLSQSQAGSLLVSSVSVTLYEPRLVDSAGFLDPSNLYNFFSSSSAGFSELCLIFDCGSASVSISFWMKPLL